MNIVDAPVYNRKDSAEYLRAIADGIEKGDYPVVVKAALVLNFDNAGKRISVFVFGSQCSGNQDGLALMVLGQQALCDQILGA